VDIGASSSRNGHTIRYLAEFVAFRRANGPTFRYLHKNSLNLRHFHRITEPMSATNHIFVFFRQINGFCVRKRRDLGSVWRNNGEMYGKPKIGASSGMFGEEMYGKTD